MCAYKIRGLCYLDEIKMNSRTFFLFNICPFLFSTKSLIFKKYTTKRKKLIEAYKIKYLPTYGRKLKITQFYEFGYITNFLRNDIK